MSLLYVSRVAVKKHLRICEDIWGLNLCALMEIVNAQVVPKKIEDDISLPMWLLNRENYLNLLCFVGALCITKYHFCVD